MSESIDEFGDPSAVRWQQRPNEVEATSTFLYPFDRHTEQLLKEAASVLTSKDDDAVGKFLLQPTIGDIEGLDLSESGKELRFSFTHIELTYDDSPGSLDLRCALNASGQHKEALTERYIAYLAAAHNQDAEGVRPTYVLMSDEVLFLSVFAESEQSLFAQAIQDKTGGMLGKGLLRDHSRIDRFLTRMSGVGQDLGESGKHAVIIDMTDFLSADFYRDNVRDIMRFIVSAGRIPGVEFRKSFASSYDFLNQDYEDGDEESGITNAQAADRGLRIILTRLLDESHTMPQLLTEIDQRFDKDESRIYMRWMVLQRQLSWLNGVRHLPKGWHTHVLVDNELMAYLHVDTMGYGLYGEASMSGGNHPLYPRAEFSASDPGAHPINQVINESILAHWVDDPLMKAHEAALADVYLKHLF